MPEIKWPGIPYTQNPWPGLKITVMRSCSFDDAVREAFRLFPKVPEIKGKQKKRLNLLLKRKDVTSWIASN